MSTKVIEDKIVEMLWPVYIGAPVEGMPNSPISYHVMQDGIYCRKNIYGDKYVFYKTDTVDGLAKGAENINPLGEEKLPIYLLRKTIDFFKYVIDHFDSSLEAYVLYGYNRDTEKYFMYIPEQEIEGASVDYDISEFRELYPNSYIVCDAHQVGAFA